MGNSYAPFVLHIYIASRVLPWALRCLKINEAVGVMRENALKVDIKNWNFFVIGKLNAIKTTWDWY